MINFVALVTYDWSRRWKHQRQLLDEMNATIHQFFWRILQSIYAECTLSRMENNPSGLINTFSGFHIQNEIIKAKLPNERAN